MLQGFHILQMAFAQPLILLQGPEEVSGQSVGENNHDAADEREMRNGKVSLKIYLSKIILKLFGLLPLRPQQSFVFPSLCLVSCTLCPKLC